MGQDDVIPENIQTQWSKKESQLKELQQKGSQLKDASNQPILVQLQSFACIMMQMCLNMAMDKLHIYTLWMRMVESIAAW